jgi:iron(III) transport system substrate-binding protein
MRPYSMTRRCCLVGAVAVLAAGLSGGSALAQSWDEVVAAAKKEGKLTLYHNLRPAGVEVLLKTFRKSSPRSRRSRSAWGRAPSTNGSPPSSPPDAISRMC